MSPESPSSTSTSSSHNDSDLDGTVSDDAEEQELEAEIVGFDGHSRFSDVTAFLENSQTTLGVNLIEIVKRCELEFYGCVKLVNYIRDVVHDAQPEQLSGKKVTIDDFDDDKYLQPRLEDDALLFHIDEILDLAFKNDSTLEHKAAPLNSEEETRSTQAAMNPESNSKATLQKARVAALEEQLAKVKDDFEAYKSLVADTLDSRWYSKDDATSRESKSVNSRSTVVVNGKATARRPGDGSASYFKSYASSHIHHTMLSDTARTSAYRDFIYARKDLFSGKIVMDLGCGTGILSMFSAKAGAKKVLAVDASDIVYKATEIVEDNKLSNVISCIKWDVDQDKSRIQKSPAQKAIGSVANGDSLKSRKASSQVLSPPAELDNLRRTKADILVSEWMGYGLLYESMLNSLITARDVYLSSSDEALIVPSHVNMLIAPVSDNEYLQENVWFWNEVWGFDMTSIVRSRKSNVEAQGETQKDDGDDVEEGDLFADAQIRTVPKERIPTKATHGCVFKHLNMYKITDADTSFSNARFELTLEEDIESLDGFLVWFDAFFLPSKVDDSALSRKSTDSNSKEAWSEFLRAEEWDRDNETKGTVLPTGPASRRTHWEQAFFLIDRRQRQSSSSSFWKAGKALKKGQKIEGTIGFVPRAENSRELEVRAQWKAPDTTEQGEQRWFLR